jgi:hypothetical protein
MDDPVYSLAPGCRAGTALIECLSQRQFESAVRSDEVHDSRITESGRGSILKYTKHMAIIKQICDLRNPIKCAKSSADWTSLVE